MTRFAERYTAAWRSHDPSSVASFFAPTGSLIVNAGAPAITALAQGFMTTFPDLHLVIDQLVTIDGHPHYHWTLTGTNSGPGGNGSRVRISGVEIWTIGADGLIVESQGSFDADDYRRQLGQG